MCSCTPSVRTPFCGAGDCKPPEGGVVAAGPTGLAIQERTYRPLDVIVNDLTKVRLTLKAVHDEKAQKHLVLQELQRRFSGLEHQERKLREELEDTVEHITGGRAKAWAV